MTSKIGAALIVLFALTSSPALAEGLTRDQVRKLWLGGSSIGCLPFHDDIVAFNVCVLEKGKQLVALRVPQLTAPVVNAFAGSLWAVYPPDAFRRECPGVELDYALLACVGHKQLLDAVRRPATDSYSRKVAHVLDVTSDLPFPGSEAAQERLSWWEASGRDEQPPPRSEWRRLLEPKGGKR